MIPINCLPTLAKVRLVVLVAFFASLFGNSAYADQQVIGRSADGTNLTIDIWAGGNGASKPALILFHGGGWRRGNTSKYSEVCEDVAKFGIACFTPSYSLNGGDGVMQDGALAVAWVRENAAKFGVNPSHIVVGGSSVGGYLAASTVLIPSRQGAASIPNALILENPVLVQFRNGPTARLKDAIHRPMPPTLLMHGTADTTADYSETQAFAASAKAAGSSLVQFISYPNRPHAFWNYRGGGNPDFFTANGHIVDFIAALGWISCRSSSGQPVKPGFTNTFDRVTCGSP